MVEALKCCQYFEPGAVNEWTFREGGYNGSCQRLKAVPDSSFNGFLFASTLSSHDVDGTVKQQTSAATKLANSGEKNGSFLTK